MNHTPGPWRAHGVQIFDSEYRLVATCQRVGGMLESFSPTEREANARLITLTPELLEAALEVVRRWPDARERIDWMGPKLMMDEAVTNLSAVMIRRRP